MKVPPTYSCSHISLDLFLGLIQILETACHVFYFYQMSFQQEIFKFLAIGFLFSLPLIHFFYANIRLCVYKGYLKLFLWFKTIGLFYERIRVSDCGFFAKITAKTFGFYLILLYFLAPFVLIFIIASLILGLAYVILNWVVSVLIFVFLSCLITMSSTIFCVSRSDLMVYACSCETVGFFYFIDSENRKETNKKMLSIKKTCILLQLLFESVPLLTINILNNKDMGYFQSGLFYTIVVWINIGLASASIFFSCLHIVSLCRYSKNNKIDTPLQTILRQSTNPNISKKETEIINMQSLDLIPGNCVAPITFKVGKLSR